MFIWVVFLSVALFILLALFFTNRTAQTPNGTLLLGVSLPLHVMKESQVTAIVSAYKRAYTRVLLAMPALLVPMILLKNYSSLCLFYFLVWTVALMLWNQKVFKQYFQQLYALKLEHGWLVGERHKVVVDTQVSRMKSTMPVSSKWFLIPVLITAGLLLAAFLKKESSAAGWLPGLQSFVSTLIAIGGYCVTARGRTVVYAADSEINFALNRSYKKAWSACWVNISVFASVISMVFYVLVGPESIFGALLPVLGACVPLVFIVTAYHQVRAQRNRLLTLVNAPCQVDEDQYWERGGYYNPDDTRFMVEKRVGYGTTVNMAHPGAKFLNFFITGAVVLVLVLGVFLVRSDFGRVEVNVVQDSISITAPMYQDTFLITDIERVERLEQLPAAQKINGMNSAKNLYGSFRVAGYGDCRLYQYREVAPVLVVHLKESKIILNGETAEQTDAFEKLLRQYAPAG